MNTKEVKEQLSNIINQSDERLLRMLLAVSKEYNEGLVSASSEKYSESYQLYRLVYTSARSARCDDAEIEKILEASRRNNARYCVQFQIISRFLGGSIR